MRLTSVHALLCLALLFALRGTLVADDRDEVPTNHAQLLTYATPDGQQRPVRTPEDWAIRRRQIIAGMEMVMGKLPDLSKLPPPEVKILGRIEQDAFTRLSITYLAAKNNRVPAYLYLPKGRPAAQRLPAMLALHPTSPFGKKVVAGEGGDLPHRAYARELAERGYVVLAPDYPSFGGYPCDFHDGEYASGTMMAIVNHIRGVDLLQARDEVDPERIGVIGHSLGGHNAIFLGVLDTRIKVIVSSSGWTPFHDYYGGDLKGWAQDRYMPRIRDVYGLDPDRVPFDFYEVVAALAPRAFFSNSPIHDENFDVRGVKKAESKVREVYALFGAAARLRFVYPDSGHDFPDAVRREAYAFIDKILDHTPARIVPSARVVLRCAGG